MCDCWNTMFKAQLPMQVQNSHELYLSGPGIHKSDLDELAVMSDYGYVNRKKKKQNNKMSFGTAAHCLILEGRKAFHDRYVMFDKYTGKGSVEKNKKAQDEFEAQGMLVMTSDDVKRLEAVRDAAMRDLYFASLVESDLVKKECSTYFHHKESDQIVATRQDIYDPGEGDVAAIVDLKVTADPAFTPFSKVCANKRYHVQCAMYTDAIISFRRKEKLHKLFYGDVQFSLFAVGDGTLGLPECGWYYFSYEDYMIGQQTYMNELMRHKNINLSNPETISSKPREIKMPAYTYYEREI